MLPLEYTGVETIGVMPPIIETANLSDKPTPITPPSILANVRAKALTNTTFQLPTSGAVNATQSKVVRLHPGTRASVAIVLLEAATGATPGAVCARFWLDGSQPTPANGLHLKDGGVFEVTGYDNIENFRIISADDLPHTIQVQYLS